MALLFIFGTVMVVFVACLFAAVIKDDSENQITPFCLHSFFGTGLACFLSFGWGSISRTPSRAEQLSHDEQCYCGSNPRNRRRWKTPSCNPWTKDEGKLMENFRKRNCRTIWSWTKDDEV